MRESASLSILPPLLREGARVVAYDPQGMKEAEHLLPGVALVESAQAAIAAAHTVVVLTEWEEFACLTPADFVGKTLVDLRNLYDPAAMHTAGVRYVGLGVSVEEMA